MKLSSNKVGQSLPSITEQILAQQQQHIQHLKESTATNENQESSPQSPGPTKTDNYEGGITLSPLAMYLNSNKGASRSPLAEIATPSPVTPIGPVPEVGHQFLTNLVHLLPLATSQQNGGPLPVSQRRVRDSGSLLVMLAFLSFLVYVIWEAIFIKQIDMNIIVHGHDSYGNICGRDNRLRPIASIDKSGQNYTQKPYTMYTLVNLYNQSDRLIITDSSTFDRQIASPTSHRLTVSQTPTSTRARNATTAPHNSSSMQIESRILYQYPASLIAAYNNLDPNDMTNMTLPKEHLRRQEQQATPWPNPAEETTSPATTMGQKLHRSSAATTRQYPFDPDDSPSRWNELEPGQDFLARQHQELIYKTECVEQCPPDYLELIFYRCMPKNWRFALFPNAINVTRTFIDDVMADLGECYKELLYIFSLALVLSLALLILLRFLASLIIWSCLTMVVTLLVAMASYSWSNYYQIMMEINTINPNNPLYPDKLSSSDRWLLGAIFLTFLTIVSVAVILIMRRRILMVTMLFRESGKALADMPLLLIQPLFTYTILMGAAVAWFLGFVCLQSVRQPLVDSRTGFVVFRAEPMYKMMKWYHIFAYLWVSHFAVACQHFVIGSAVSKWYFSPQKYHLSSPIGSSISDLILYHLGSVALGSFLVAIFKVIRVLAKQIQMLVHRNCLTQSPNSHDSSSSPNSLLSANSGSSPNLVSSTTCCGSCSYIWRCFIWFFDNMVMIINRDAYVEIAIHGYSFIEGAKQAFKILASNPLKLLAIKSFGSCLLVITKICVVVSTVSVAILLLEDKTQHLNYSWSPIIVSGLYAYIVAHWFLSVYEMVIDALFICYCEDYQMSNNQGFDSNQLTGSTLMTQLINSAAQLHLA